MTSHDHDTRRDFGLRFDALIERVMLHPGGHDSARLVLAVRYFILICNVCILVWVCRGWRSAPEVQLLLAGIDLAVLSVTVALSLATRLRSERLLGWVLVGVFTSDLLLELIGLMSSGLTHSTLVVMPLVTIMTAAVVLDLRRTLGCAAVFVVGYPLCAALFDSGWWPFATALGGADSGGLLTLQGRFVFVLTQEVYFALALTPYLVLVAKLRARYRDFHDRLEAATRRIEAEVQDRVHERSVAEHAIREQERRYRLLAENVTDMVTLCDRELRCVYVSPSAATVLGYGHDELRGTPLRDLVHADDWPTLERGLRRAVPADAADATGPARGREFVVEHRARHQDGHWVWLETHGRWMATARGEPADTILSSRDITARRELEESIRQTQKLESLGLLAGGVAHDFNNILMGISGRAELAAQPGARRELVDGHLTSILKSARRAADLCQQMLTYSGKGTATFTPVSLNQLLREMPTLLGAAIPLNARLTYELSDELPAIDGDAGQLRQVAMNLILNAAEAVAEHGGEVRVTSGAGRFDELLQECPGRHQAQWLTVRPVGTQVHLTVTDTGCGMDEVTLAKMFDPFFTTKFAGRGLGLAAVVGIVNSHHGFIRVASEPGHGTQVCVGFPESASAVDAAGDDDAASSWRGHGLVLVVDDEEDVCDVVASLLRSLGFEVLSALDGTAALELFRRRAAEITFVVCDVAMPGLDGEQLVRALREVRANIKVIMTSGFGQAELARRFEGAGIDRLLRKPFSAGELAEAARALTSAG